MERDIREAISCLLGIIGRGLVIEGQEDNGGWVTQ